MKFYIRKNTVLLLLLLMSQKAFTQDHDLGLWLDASAIKKYASTSVLLYSELYTNDNNQSIDRIGLGFEVSQKVSPILNVGIGYLFMDKNKMENYEQRHRFYSQAKVSKEIKKIKLSFRERLQLTRYPEDNLSCDYLSYWRNRLKISYKIDRSRITPLIGVETFLLLNNTESKQMDEVRYNVSALCAVSGSSNIEFYALLSRMHELNQYVLGISYQITI